MSKPRGAVRIEPSMSSARDERAGKEPDNKQPSKQRGAKQHKVNLKGHGESWARHHSNVCKSSLKRLLSTPMVTLMTVAVLAIALTLPGFMFSALASLKTLTQGWQGETRITLYLQASLSDEEADRFGRSLLLRDDIAAIDMISSDQGMLEFKKYAGFGDVLDSLDNNPLPAVVMILPKGKNAADLGIQRAAYQAMPEVEDAILDMEWLQRLEAILAVAQRSVFVLGVLLGLAVLLVVGNTIRTSIESRRDEIVVSKLVGATDAWVRRPFLYTGFWYGLMGAVLAWLMIQLAWLMLETPSLELAELYRSRFELSGLGWIGTGILLISSVVLGWLGAWLSVRRHLRDIEPR